MPTSPCFAHTHETILDTPPRLPVRFGAFKGYKLTVTESHQSSKVDTSGTAKAIVESFNELGCAFDISEVELVRDVPTQVGRMGVPEVRGGYWTRARSPLSCGSI